MNAWKSAPHKHAEALLNVYEILQGLQDRGVLELAKGALGSSEEVLQILFSMANRPEMIRGVRNAIILIKVADFFPPELLEGVEEGVKEGLVESQKPKPFGLWQLVKKLLSHEARRVLVLTATILQSVGMRLSK
jgi:uncharacterized protein YjgD (DUF1641 family)